MAEFNFDHLTKQQHARNRVTREIQENIREGTLSVDVLRRLRDNYYEEVKHLDVPARVHDSLSVELALLGDCGPDAIELYLTTQNMPNAEQRRASREAIQAAIDTARGESSDG